MKDENLQAEHDAKRKQYMAHEITHHEFYRWLGDRIGVTSDSLSQRIKDRLPKSTDPHMNDIPLRLWDMHHEAIRQRAGWAGMRSWSQSDTVCVLKALARDIKYEQQTA